MSEIALDLADVRRREFRRMVGLSLGAHLVAVILMIWSPGLPRFEAPPGVIAVDLVAMSSPRPAAPAARPSPPKPPPPPVPKKVVLPKEPEAPKPVPAEKPPEPVRKELDPEDLAPEEPAQQDYTDVLAQLRAEAGEEAGEEAAAPTEVARAGTPGTPGGLGRPVSPEVAAWLRKVKIHVRRAWVVPPGFRTQPLQTHVMVELDAQGGIIGEPEIVRRSGNPWYDDGVVRAIQKASPLPAPPEAGEWPFVFTPEDSF